MNSIFKLTEALSASIRITEIWPEAFDLGGEVAFVDGDKPFFKSDDGRHHYLSVEELEVWNA